LKERWDGVPDGSDLDKDVAESSFSRDPFMHKSGFGNNPG